MGHTIQPGDSLARIANDYCTTVSQLLRLNPDIPKSDPDSGRIAPAPDTSKGATEGIDAFAALTCAGRQPLAQPGVNRAYLSFWHLPDGFS